MDGVQGAVWYLVPLDYPRKSVVAHTGKSGRSSDTKYLHEHLDLMEEVK